MKNLQQNESRLMQVDFKSVEEKIAIENFDHKCFCDEPQYNQGFYRTRPVYVGHSTDGRKGESRDIYYH